MQLELSPHSSLGMGKAVNMKQEQTHPKLPKQHYRKAATTQCKEKISKDSILPYLPSKNTNTSDSCFKDGLEKM